MMIKSLALTALAASASLLLPSAQADTNTSYPVDYYAATTKVWIDNGATTNTIKSLIYPLATSYLTNVTGIPDQTFNADGVDVALSNIRVSNISVPYNDLNIGFAPPNILSINASNVAVSALADYSASASLVSGVNGQLTASVSKVALSLVTALTTDGKGHLIPLLQSSDFNIGNLHIDLGGAAGGLLNSFLPAVQTQITNTLETTVQQQLAAQWNQTLVPYLRNAPLTMQLPYYDPNAQVYYGLVDETNPQNNNTAIDITSQFVRLALALQAQPKEGLNVPPPTNLAHHAINNTFPAYLNGSHPDLAVGIDQYVINTALYTAAVTNASYTITNASLPAAYQSYFTTATLSFIYPQLAQQYPDAPLVAAVSPAVVQNGDSYKYPHVDVSADGNHPVYAPLNVHLGVLNNGEVVPLADLLVTVNTTVSFGFQPVSDTNYKIVGNANYLSFDIQTLSQQYNFQPPLESFSGLLSQLAPQGLATLNGIAQKGYTLPQIPYAHLVNPQFQFSDNVIYLLTSLAADQ